MEKHNPQIPQFLNLLKKELCLSSHNYAQLNFLINKFRTGQDEQSKQTLVHLYLLMALLYHSNGSYLTFQKYFSLADELAQRFKYRFQDIIEAFKTESGQKKDSVGNQNFSETELKLINIIKKEKLNKFDLIERLYGTDADILVAENRLKNLIFRIRKKNKGLIVCHDGVFSLASTID